MTPFLSGFTCYIYSSSSGISQFNWEIHRMAQEHSYHAVQWPWMINVKLICAKPQQNTTKREPCAYFMGCTVYTVNRTQMTLRWRHNEHDGVSIHQRFDCLLNRLFRRGSKKTSKLRVTGLCEGNSPVTGEFPAQRASNAENVSIWWRHRGTAISLIAKISSRHFRVGSIFNRHRAEGLCYLALHTPRQMRNADDGLSLNPQTTLYIISHKGIVSSQVVWCEYGHEVLPIHCIAKNLHTITVTSHERQEVSNHALKIFQADNK